MPGATRGGFIELCDTPSSTQLYAEIKRKVRRVNSNACCVWNLSRLNIFNRDIVVEVSIVVTRALSQNYEALLNIRNRDYSTKILML